MKNQDLDALFKECCLELGIEWVDESGPSVICGQRADLYFQNHTVFPQQEVYSITLDYPEKVEDSMELNTSVEVQVDSNEDILKAA
ncbi:hypothetical protein [Acidaminococcus timonensis]|jgi:hypothetical protein|uniref:hypothetical protein n=1 Tax=Acidaminococcus TaxID=904 RepID=UPI0025E28830|nr:hypothetical protein [Acidaminococcus timonensis]